MPAPISDDLRERVVRIYGEGSFTYEEVASRLLVSRASVSRILGRQRTTGTVSPKPATGGPPRMLDEKHRQELFQLVDLHPDETLEQLRVRWTEGHPTLPASARTIGRELQKAGYTRKKSASSNRKRDRRG